MNRLHKVLEDAGVTLATVATDVMGVSGREMMHALIARGGRPAAVGRSGQGPVADEAAGAAEGVDGVKGVIFTVQKALPLLTEKASIVLTGSTTSVRVGPGQSVYAATKAAVRNVARGWAVDLSGRAIRVNVLSPGPTRTPGLLGRVDPDRRQTVLDSFAATVPLGRVAEPEEIAGAAAFLASDDASFVNGIEFFVDGGHAQI